jgi:hypothetical protein
LSIASPLEEQPGPQGVWNEPRRFESSASNDPAKTGRRV